MPISTFGTTPGAAPTGKFDAIGFVFFGLQRICEEFVRARIDDVKIVAVDCQALRLPEALDDGGRCATAVDLNDAAFVALGDEARAVAGDCESGRSRQSARLFLDRAAGDFQDAALAAVRDEYCAAGSDCDVVEFMEFGREHLHFVRNRMIGSDVAAGGRHDQHALGALGDAAHEAREMTVEEQADPVMRAVGRDRRHADTVGGINRSVVRNCDSHRAAKSRRNQPPLGAVRHDFANAAINEMRDEEAVVVGQGEVVDSGAHLRDHAAFAALYVEAQNLAAGALGRKQRALAVEFDRGRHRHVGGEDFRLAAFELDAPDFVGADCGKVDIAVGTDIQRVGQRQVLRDFSRRATVGEQFEHASVVTAFVHKEAIAPLRNAVGGRHVVRDDAQVAVGRSRAHPLAHHFGDVQDAARVESEIVGRDDWTADRTNCGDRAAADVDGADLAAEGLRDIQAAVGADAHSIGAEQRARRGDSAYGPSFGRADS